MRWNSEAEAREQIKALVAEYYADFKRPQQDKPFAPGDRIAYASRVYDEKEMCALVDATLDFWLTTGRFSEQFEKEFAAWIGVKYAHLVNSGSSANLIAFMTLTAPELGERQIRRGDEVITVACGFPTTVTPILLYGAVPVFVDVTVPQYNIDVTKLEGALSEKTKAVMIAHTLGNPFDLRAVRAFCEAHNLYRNLGRHRHQQLLPAPPHDHGRGRLRVHQRSLVASSDAVLPGLGPGLRLPFRARQSLRPPLRRPVRTTAPGL